MTIFNREHVDAAVFDGPVPLAAKPGDIVALADDDFRVVGEVPNIDLFPALLAGESWVDAQVRIWAPILGCDPVALSKLLEMALIVANAHNELLTRDQAMDAIRAMMGTKK